MSKIIQFPSRQLCAFHGIPFNNSLCLYTVNEDVVEKYADQLTPGDWDLIAKCPTLSREFVKKYSHKFPGVMAMYAS